MNDQLEDFIRQHKGAFDDKQPPENSWNKINDRIFKKVTVWNSLHVWRAAAIILFGICLYLVLPALQREKEDTLALNEFKDIESFYINQITHKTDLLSDQRDSETGLNGFTHDFQQLQAMYEVLKEEMKSNPNQKVKDALVLNLLIQIDLLNQQLHKIEQGEAHADKTTQSNI